MKTKRTNKPPRKLAPHGFPAAGQPGMRHLHAMIDDDLDESLRIAARKLDRTLSSIVTEALERWFLEEPVL